MSPDRSQQGELLLALTHTHGEGVHDDERADEHRQDHEDEQEGLDIAEYGLDVGVLLIDALGARLQARRVGEQVGDRAGGRWRYRRRPPG